MATTLANIRETLGDYTERNGEFLPAVNQVLARLYDLGVYRDLTVEYSLPVLNSIVVLPEDAHSILHSIVGNQPTYPQSLWHDYKIYGSEASGFTQLVDDGYSPVITQVPEGGVSALYLSPSALDPTASGAPPAESVVIVDGDDGSEVFRGTFTGDGASTTLTLPDTITNIRSIRFDRFRENRFDLLYTSGDLDTSFATVGPGNGVVRYRRFRVSSGVQDGTYVHTLCRRKFIPLRNDDDLSYVSNIGAIKMGLLARLHEDNSDLARADAFWARCAERMDEESQAATGAAMPILRIDPHGIGGRDPIESML